MRKSITTRADSVRVVQLGSAGNPSTAVWPFPLQLLLKPAQRNNIIIKSAIATYIGITYLSRPHNPMLPIVMLLDRNRFVHCDGTRRPPCLLGTGRHTWLGQGQFFVRRMTQSGIHPGSRASKLS